MTADEFKKMYLDPLHDAAREQGLFFGALVVEPEWFFHRGRIRSTAVIAECGPDLEGVQMLRDRLDQFRDALR